MPRVGGSSDSSTGTSTSTDSDTDTDTDTDTGTDNRRAAVESDPGDVSGGSSVDTTPDSDTSNREAAVELDTGSDVSGPTDPATDTSQSSSPSPPTDTGTSNRRQAATNDGSGSVPSTGGGGGASRPTTDTTPDRSNRGTALGLDPGQQIERITPRPEGAADPSTDPDGTRFRAVSNDPGNDIPVGPDTTDPNDAADGRRRAVEEDTGQDFSGPDPTEVERQQSNEFEEIRREVAAEQQGLGPGDITVDRNGDEFSISLTDDAQREQAAADIATLGADDLRITDSGGVGLTDDAREQRIRSQAALSLGVSQEEVNVFGDADGDLSPSLTDDGFESAATRQAARQSDALEADDFQVVERNGERFVQPTDDGLVEAAAETTDNEAIRESDLQVVNTDDGRAVQLTEDGRERLAGLQQDEEQFGDFEIFLPGLNRSLEEISGDAAEGVQDTFAGAADSLVNFGTSGSGVTGGLNPDGRLASYASGGVRGAGDLVAAPFTAFNAGKEGVELVGYGASETVQGRGSEFVSDLRGATGSAVVSAGDAFKQSPVESTGRLVSGALLTGGAISGASRVGGTTAGRATSAVIQPGEELARYAARTGRIPTSAATRVPGVRESNIDPAAAGTTDGPSLTQRASGAVSDATPDVSVRFDPDSSPLELNTDLQGTLRNRFDRDTASGQDTATTTVDADDVEVGNTPVGNRGPEPDTGAIDADDIEVGETGATTGGYVSDSGEIFRESNPLGTPIARGNIPSIRNEVRELVSRNRGSDPTDGVSADDIEVGETGTSTRGFVNDDGDIFTESNPLGRPLQTDFQDSSVSDALRERFNQVQSSVSGIGSQQQTRTLFIDDDGNPFTESNPLGTPAANQFDGSGVSDALREQFDRVRGSGQPTRTIFVDDDGSPFTESNPLGTPAANQFDGFDIPRPDGRIRDVTVSVGRRDSDSGPTPVDADDIDIGQTGVDASRDFDVDGDDFDLDDLPDAADSARSSSGGRIQTQTEGGALELETRTRRREADQRSPDTDSLEPRTPFEFVSDVDSGDAFSDFESGFGSDFGGTDAFNDRFGEFDSVGDADAVGEIDAVGDTQATPPRFDTGVDTGTGVDFGSEFDTRTDVNTETTTTQESELRIPRFGGEERVDSGGTDPFDDESAFDFSVIEDSQTFDSGIADSDELEDLI